MDGRGKGERVGQHPLSPTRVKLSLTRLHLRTYDITYMESISSQFIQKVVDHVDPHTQFLPTQAQIRLQSMAINFKNIVVSEILDFNCPMR